MNTQLNQAKQEYEEYISRYMYEHHTSFKTFEQTKQTWRTERAYTEQIEAEIVKKSLLFLSLLDKSFDINSRRDLANFMADYLSVYVLKSPKYASDIDMTMRKNRAYTELNNRFLIQLDFIRKRMSKSESSKPTKGASNPMLAQNTVKLTYNRIILKQDDMIIQKITLNDKTVAQFTYPDLATYRRKRNKDFESIAGHSR